MVAAVGPSMIARRAEAVVEDALRHFRVVVVHGARQSGKTTLVQRMAARQGSAYVTLDRPVDLAAATTDPETFLGQFAGPLVVDEIQRAGQPLVLAVKLAVDGDQRPGRFLLTGSTNFLTVPSISESLAGRVDLVQLWPLSFGELLGGDDDFVDRAFGEPGGLVRHRGAVLPRERYFDLVCHGGFPAAHRLPDGPRRRWLNRYVQTVLEREVLVAADIRRGEAMSRMVRYFAAATASELVLSRVGERLGLDQSTVSSYEPWLETVFLVHRAPAWSRNLTAKVVRRPKMYMTDTGLAAALLAKSPAALARLDEPAAGPLLETLVANELAKQLTWSSTPARIHHFRDSGGAEVDAVLEADDGRVVAVEVKASRTPRVEDARWMAMLRDRLDRIGDDFTVGVVLHTGTHRVSLGDRLVALPIADLWT